VYSDLTFGLFGIFARNSLEFSNILASEAIIPSKEFMEQQPRKRRRPALSCISCRSRKIKCDRNDPCNHCLASKTECAYQVYISTVDKSDFLAHSSIITRSGQIDHANKTRRQEVPPLSHVQGSESDLQALLQRVDALERSSTLNHNNDLDENRKTVFTNKLQESQLILSKTRVLKWSHWSSGEVLCLCINFYCFILIVA
jgi:hypothetical protein